MTCDGTCTDVTADASNCGACGRTCSTANVATVMCAGGLCASTCQAGYWNVSRPAAPTADDGCETQTAPACGEGPSCAGGLDCNGETCCTSFPVPGGTYDRGADAASPATVSDFCLDRYEVTVGRFREFVNDYDRWISTAGGSHPVADEGERGAGSGSGWQTDWNPGDELPASADAFKDTSHLKCDANYQTWTDAVSGNENLPINCVNWYEAFAFCIWDGGFLATEAQWEYAAGHGSENRTYPWGNAPDPDNAHAVFGCQWDGSITMDCAFSDLAPVGSVPAGNGFWGQSDLAGGMWEWTLDAWGAAFPVPCDDCANLDYQSGRVVRGGSWEDDFDDVAAAYRHLFSPTFHYYVYGARCARAPR
jgi:formylglycine-generating enzyme